MSTVLAEEEVSDIMGKGTTAEEVVSVELPIVKFESNWLKLSCFTF